MTRPTLDKLPYGFKVEAAAEAVSLARHRVRTIAGDLDLGMSDEALFDLELMAGEVIANAVTHTGAACAVCVRWTGKRLRIEVTDPYQTASKLRAVAPDDESGRGLLLVDTLADAWGTTPDTAGKTTWFEIAAASPFCGENSTQNRSPDLCHSPEGAHGVNHPSPPPTHSACHTSHQAHRAA